MKKEYMQPNMRIIPVKATQMLCMSNPRFVIGNDNYSGDVGIDVE